MLQRTALVDTYKTHVVTYFDAGETDFCRDMDFYVATQI